MAALRSVAFALIFYLGTVGYVLAATFAFLFGSARLRAVVEAWARYHRLCARWILGISSRVVGTVPSGAVLVAAKHQSMFETIESLPILGAPQVVMKGELARIPLWGRLARLYGMIVVDREGGAAALRQLLLEGEAAVAHGRTVVIFPEGTRVAPGEQPPLQAGFGGLYRALGLPVVPLALDSGRVWPRRSFVKRPGVITMRFGEAIPAGLPRKEAEARVHAAINALERPAN